MNGEAAQPAQDAPQITSSQNDIPIPSPTKPEKQLDDHLTRLEALDERLLAEKRGSPDEVRYWQEIEQRILKGEKIPRPQTLSSAPPAAIGTWQSDQIRASKADFTRYNLKHEEVPNAGAIADFIHLKYSSLAFNNTTYIFDRKKGIFREDRGEVDRSIQMILEHIEWDSAAIHIRREIKAHLFATNVYPEYPFDYRQDLVPFKNCCTQYNPKIGGWDVVEWDRKYLFRYQIPTEYHQIFDTAPVDHLFQQWVEPEDVIALYQAPAQAILQAILRQPFKKAYLLKGERNSGKTSYLELLARAFGTENIARVPLQHLGKQFALAPLEGVLLNVYDDLSNFELKDIGVFKTLTGACEHQIERKHQMPYNGRITAVHIFSCNEPPRVDSMHDEAFWARWEYVIFPNEFPTDPGFIARTFTPDFMQHFVFGVMKEAARMMQVRGLSRDTHPEDVRDAWSYATNPIYRFVQEVLNRDMSGFIETERIYQAYVSWCNERHIVPKDKSRLGRALPQFGFVKKQSRKAGNLHGYGGCTFKDQKPAKDPAKSDQSSLNGDSS
jgi:phage/plasmid-associated DNA primase